jgi:hypothetical protein
VVGLDWGVGVVRRLVIVGRVGVRWRVAPTVGCRLRPAPAKFIVEALFFASSPGPAKLSRLSFWGSVMMTS